MQNDALSSFLSSSLNVELVFILLSSITTFSKKKDEDSSDKSMLVQIRNEAARQKLQNATVIPINFQTSQDSIEATVQIQRRIERTLVLSQIKIKNVEKWDGAEAKDFVKQKSDISFDETNHMSNTLTSSTDDQRDLTINEDVRTTEYAPAIF